MVNLVGTTPKELVAKALSEGRTKLLEHEALALAEYYGIPVARYGIALSEDDVEKVIKSVGFPAVAKVVSPDISHKSDVGGVILGIKDVESALKAYKQIMENVKKNVPNARVTGVLYQKMAEPGYIEVIVGATRDPTFGPVIMFGLGGIFVEVLKDVSFRVAPLEPEDAEEMIKEIKTHKILEGYRGMPPRDVESIKDILMKVSKLMLEVDEIQDIDLNPIMLYEKGKGAVAVDVRVILKEKK